MNPVTPATRGFRRGLAQALPGWVEEGIVSASAAEMLRMRYALDDAAGSMQRLLLLCIYMVGAALIGGGAITFVAANWSAIPQAGQAGLLIAVLLALHLTGYHIGYQRKTHPGLGHALIVVGTLMFGASIPLFGQIFLIEGDWRGGLAMWALGAGAMALAVGSVPTALAAIAGSLIAHIGYLGHLSVPAWWYAPLVAVAGLGFGRVHGSRAVTALTLVAAVTGLLFHAGPAHGFHGVLAAALVSGLLLTSAGHLHGKPTGATATGTLALLIFAYIASFQAPAESAFPPAATYLAPPAPLALHWGLLLPMGVGAASLWGWALAAGSLKNSPATVLAGLYAATAILLCLVLVLGDSTVLVIAANAALITLGGVMLWAGTRLADRLTFWTGMIVIGAVIIGRFFEIDTGLLAKSAVFVACGIAVIAAGLRFEKTLRTQEATR